MEHSLTSLLEIKRCARNLQIKPRANGRNIFGCYMLRMFPHPVACSVVLLGAVAQSLKLIKRLAQQCWDLLRPFSRSFSQKSDSG